MRKIVVRGGLVLVSLLLLLWVYRFLSTGTITVTSNSAQDTVGIAKITKSGEQPNPYAKQAVHKLTIRVKAGQYKLTVSNRTAAASKVIYLKARQHVSYTLAPPPIITPEPVFGHGATSIGADSSRLLFINPANSYLTAIDSSNYQHTLDIAHPLSSASWNSTAYGIGLSGNNRLYAITNGAFNELSLPFTPDASRGSVAYALAPDGRIYVSNGVDIYTSTSGSSFKKIYKGKFDRLRLSASNNRLAIYYTGTENTEGQSSGSIKPSLTLINPSGQTIAANDGNFYVAAWSKDGKYLLAQNSKVIAVYDSSLHLIRSFPTNNSTNSQWIGPAEFAYSVEGDLWKASVDSNQSSLLARMEGNTISGLYTALDGSYVYISSESNHGSKSLVTRAGLRGQRDNGSAQTLNVFLPENIGVCSLNYVNFTAPVVTVSYPPSTTGDFCADVARGELRSNGIDPNAFGYQLNPATQSDTTH